MIKKAIMLRNIRNGYGATAKRGEIVRVIPMNSKDKMYAVLATGGTIHCVPPGDLFFNKVPHFDFLLKMQYDIL